MASLDEVSRSIGELQGQVRFLTQLATDHNDATRGIQSDLDAVKTDLKTVKDDVAAFKPVARKVGKWEQRIIGFGAFGGLLGAIAIERIKGWW